LLYLNKRELGLIFPLLLLMLFMGVYPRVFLDRSKSSVVAIRDRVSGNQAGGSYTTELFLPQRRKDAKKK
jgi:NADH-quinone oxidoreductase subunit M